MDKVEWETTGWGYLGKRARFLMWLIRQMYRLGFLDEEMAKMYAKRITGIAIEKKVEKTGGQVKTV